MSPGPRRTSATSPWAGEPYGPDAATVLAFLADTTESISLGSGVFQMPGEARR